MLLAPTTRARLSWLCCLLLFLFPLFVGGLLPRMVDGAEPTWQAGIAKAVVTPEKSVWLAGYGAKRPPDGKLHDLWMKAMALEDAEGRALY